MENIRSILGGIFAGILVMSGVVYLAYKALQPKTEEKSKEKTPDGDSKIGWSWVKHPVALITYGLIVFNLVSRAMIPWFWGILTYTWYTSVCFNVALWTVLYLRTIKVKDANGKDTKDDHPTAGKLAGIIALMLVVGIATTTWSWFWRDDLSQEEYEKKVATEKAMKKAEPVLAIIAECRSKDFDTADKVKRANELYREKGLMPWMVFSDCWGVKLDVPEVDLAILKAPTEDFGEVIKFPTTRGYKVFWDSPQQYSVKVNEDNELILEKGEEIEGTLESARFKGASEPATIRVWLTKPTKK